MVVEPMNNDLARRLAANAMLTGGGRSAYAARLGITHDGDRDMYAVFGYPKNLTLEMFWAEFKRGLGSRVVRAGPEACWSKTPEVLDSDDKQNETPFEIAVRDFFKRRNMLSIFHRLDICTRLGQYGILLLGISDAQTSDKPVKGKLSPSDIMYMTPYMQMQVRVDTYDIKPESPRFGQPEMYAIDIGNYDQEYQAGNQGPTRTIRAHWTRVIHVAENPVSNTLLGTPAMEAAYNTLLDLLKTTGGSGELYWLNGRGGTVADVAPDVSNIDTAAIAEQFDNYTHGLTRNIRTQGVTTSVLSHPLADPSPTHKIAAQTLAAITGIPMRVLFGSERGELASSQDETNWLKKVAHRQKTFCGPEIVKAFVDRMVAIGVFPAPVNDMYDVKFNEKENISEVDKANIGLLKAQTLATGATLGVVGSLVSEQQFIEEIMDMEYRVDDLEDTSDYDEEE